MSFNQDFTWLITFRRYHLQDFFVARLKDDYTHAIVLHKTYPFLKSEQSVQMNIQDINLGTCTSQETCMKN